MATQLFANNASSTLASGITAVATSATLATGQGAMFPTPTGGDWFLLTLTQPTGPESSWEIVKVTARTADTLTIVRAQEGTTAVAWDTAKVEHRLTAGSMPAAGGSPFATDIVVNGINIGKGTGGAATNFNLQTGNLTAQQSGALYSTQTVAGGYTVTAPVYPTAGCYVNGVVLELVSGTCLTLPTVTVTKFSTFLSIANPTINLGTSTGAVFTLPDVTGQWANTGTKMTWVVGLYPDTPNNTVAIGANVLTAATGNSNLGIGINAGSAITTGKGNVIIGSDTGATIATSNNNLLISNLEGTTRLHVGPYNQLGIGSSNFGTSGQVLKSQGAFGAAAWGAIPAVPLTRVAITMTTSYFDLGANTATHYDITNTGGYGLNFISWGYGLAMGDEITLQFLNDTVLAGGVSYFPGIASGSTMKAGDVLVLRQSPGTFVSKVVAYYSTAGAAAPSLGANLTAIAAMSSDGVPYLSYGTWYQASTTNLTSSNLTTIATNYGNDGYKFVPATSSTNSGKVLTAGTYGAMSWTTPSASIARATVAYTGSYITPGSTDHIDLTNAGAYGAPSFIYHSLPTGGELTIQFFNPVIFTAGSYFQGISANLTAQIGDVIVFRNLGSFQSKIVAYYPAAGFAGKVGAVLTGVMETKVAVSASAIDLLTGNYFSKTATGALTWSVTNVPASGTVASFILDLTNGGLGAQTWGFYPLWPGGTAPSLSTNKRDVLGFFTHDGGSTWNGMVLAKGMA